MRGFPEQRLELLRSLSLFRGCNDKELVAIDGLVDDIVVSPGEVLTTEGASGAQQSFIIVAGQAEVSVGGARVSVLSAGAFFGEMSLLDLKPRSATVTALTPMQLLVVPMARFMDLLEQPNVAVQMLKGVVARLRDYEGVSARA